MKQLLFTKIAFFTLPLLLLIACGGKTSSEPTLTFHKNGCSYSGPATVASQFTLTWIVEDSGHSGYVYGLVTLDHGKSVQDLATIPAEDPPPSWVTKLNADYQASPGTYTESIDLRANASSMKARSILCASLQMKILPWGQMDQLMSKNSLLT